MADTPRSLSYLVGTSFLGGTPSSIPSQALRDFAVSAILSNGGSTSAAILPSGTTAQQPNTGAVGNVRYNSDTGRYEFGVGSAWKSHVRLDGDTMTGSLTLQGGGSNLTVGNTIQATGLVTALGGLWTHQNVVLSGTTLVNNAKLGGNISGTYTTSDDNAAVVSIVNSTDTAALTAANSGGYPSLSIVRQFGGAGCFGGRIGFNSTLWCAAAVTGDTSAQQYQAGNFAAKATVNVGGTDDHTPGNQKGFLYGGAYYGLLQPGATNWALVNALGEIDLGVSSPSQTLTIGGTVTAGDVLTVTFTSSSIVGSPVSVSYTVQSGNSLYNIKNNIIAAIQNNTALANAGVTASIPLSLSSGPAIITWNTNTSVVVSVSTSVGATETLTLGGATTGASTARKLGASIVRLLADAQPGGSAIDTALLITSQLGTPTTGAFNYGLSFGDGISDWPLSRTATLMWAAPRTASGSSTTQLPPAKLTRGIDLSLVDFADQSGYSLFLPGFSVSGVGTISLGSAQLSYSSNGLTVDAVGYAASGNATVVSGGNGVAGGSSANYFVGDVIYDSFGGQHRVTSVSSTTGKVTGISTLVQPFTTGSLPASTQSTTGGSGNGLTIGLTWSASTTMKLNPSGGAIQPGSGAWTANGSVATALSSVGPTGSHTTVQEWFTVTNASGTIRYIPAF
jgi:hypothetical protein